MGTACICHSAGGDGALECFLCASCSAHSARLAVCASGAQEPESGHPAPPDLRGFLNDSSEVGGGDHSRLNLESLPRVRCTEKTAVRMESLTPLHQLPQSRRRGSSAQREKNQPGQTGWTFERYPNHVSFYCENISGLSLKCHCRLRKVC